AITDTLTKGITVENLKPDTKYYFRSFVMDDENVKYGDVISFQTLYSYWYSPYTDSRDGNVYKTVKIGSQIWMAENLKYLPNVAMVGEGSKTKSYYYVYNSGGTGVEGAKATYNYKTYGVLYNWPAAKKACPSGWHLPSDSEWEQMENYLADNGFNYDGTTGGGRDKIAKALASKSGWSSSSSTGSVGNTDYSSYRNKTGFTALPGGYRSYGGYFYDLGHYGYWWSATLNDSDNAWKRGLCYSYGSVSRYYSNKGSGSSVRCVRD
ncbi:MAG: fibrobacter succinogenes major paralogous domain-containing protein, partial [Bacteroidales bacterium]|nr:fibrobacter succinogenes major paralogous domain-containing protein [Bacteroidales bacterium]